MPLTPAQIKFHIGNMLDDVTNLPAARNFIDDELWRGFIRAAVWYRNNGSSGSQEDRQEAMRAFIRALYTRLTGYNPNSLSHHFVDHWCGELVEDDKTLFE